MKTAVTLVSFKGLSGKEVRSRDCFPSADATMGAEVLPTMLATQCPPRNQLRDFLDGKLHEEDSNVMAEHLESCAVCEQVASDLDLDPDSLVEALKSPQELRSHSLNGARSPAEANSSPLQGAEDPQTVASQLLPASIASYELQNQLGSGGMGAVYLARHRTLDKEVAVKLLPALPARRPEYVARFQREIRAAGRLDHPAIVRTTDAGEEQGVHFLVMDVIRGLDLSRTGRALGKLDVADACEVVRQAALGLSHAHEKGIVHRDIKPSNLMLDESGRVRILDFGLAQMGVWDSGSAEITSVGQLMGTLDYMSPEQAERGGAVNYKADIYSLGASLFRLLTGRAPLAAAPDLTPLEKLRLLATHQAPRLETLCPQVPKQLADVVENLLSRDPANRAASAAHVAELLEPFCDGNDLTAALREARSVRNRKADSAESQDSLEAAYPNPRIANFLAQASPESTSARSFWTPLITWLTLAIAGLGIAGGFMFVLEASKGQLVIESEDAEVQVKIVEVGNDAAAEELSIVPGAQSTRLRSGKYEVILASPSDQFSVSNETFTIRNGDVIVARITQKPSADTRLPSDSTSAEIASGNAQLEQQNSELPSQLYALITLITDAQKKLADEYQDIQERSLELSRSSPNVIWTKDGAVDPYADEYYRINAELTGINVESSKIESSLEFAEKAIPAGKEPGVILEALRSDSNTLKFSKIDKNEERSDEAKLELILSVLRERKAVLAVQTERLRAAANECQKHSNELQKVLNNQRVLDSQLTTMQALMTAYTEKLQEIELMPSAAFDAQESVEESDAGKEQQKASANSASLERITYNGDSLKAWLERLQYERSEEKLQETFEALFAMASPATNEIIEHSSIQFLRTAAVGKSFDRAIRLILYTAKGDAFNQLTQVLETASREQTLMAIQSLDAAASVHAIEIENPDSLTKFLNWSSARLEPSNENLAKNLRKLFRALQIDYAGVNGISAPVRENLAEWLASQAALNDDNFWLKEIEGRSSFKYAWSRGFRKEVRKRAIATLKNADSSNDSFINACGVLDSTIRSSYPLSLEEKTQLVTIVEQNLKRLVDDKATDLRVGQCDVKSFLLPVVPNTEFHVGLAIPETSRYISILELARQLEINNWDRELLKSAFDAVGKLPIGTRRFFGEYGEFPRRTEMKWMSWENNFSSADAMFAAQIIYAQIGVLLDYQPERVYARFAEYKPADVDREVAKNLRTLEFELDRDLRQLALQSLQRVALPRHAPLVVPAIKAFLLKKRNQSQIESQSGQAFGLLNQLAPEEFLDNYAECIANATAEMRFQFLQISLSNWDLRVTKRSSLRGLLDFYEDQLIELENEAPARAPVPNQISKWVYINQIRGLLRLNDDQLSADCKDYLVSRLKSWSFLTDAGFWLSSPARSHTVSGYWVGDTLQPLSLPSAFGKEFRSEQVRRSIRVLEDRNAESMLHLKAMMVIRSINDLGDELTPEQKKSLLRSLETFLDVEPKSVEKLFEVHRNSIKFVNLDYPAIPGLKWDRGRTNEVKEATTNKAVLAMSLLTELKLQIEKAVLLRLYAALDENEIETNYYSSGQIYWDFKPSSTSVVAWQNKPERIWQTLYLQAGRMLGRDLNYLLAKPERVRAKKARLIQPGDVLAVHVPQILPSGDADPPVIQAGNSPPVNGYPVSVSESGTINLPLIDEVDTTGMDLDKLSKQLRKMYTENDIIRERYTKDITVAFLMRAGRYVELRNVTGQSLPKKSN